MSRDPTPQTNARIAALYDVAPYDPQPNATVTPERLMGLAALYGLGAEIGDVLDLGCGTGVELARMAGRTEGHLLGVDLSSVAVATAQQRCAVFGERVQVRRADLLDLAPEDLGQFDLILHYGVIGFVPPPVRDQALTLIAGCLKPGGLAVLSYYAGALPALRAILHRTLRATLDPTRTVSDEILRARARIKGIADAVPANVPGRDLLMAALDQTAGQGDTLFLHEVLNHGFEALQTAELEAALAPQGVSFLTYLDCPSIGMSAASKDRAITADALDFQQGGYRFALFGKAPEARAPNVRHPKVRWTTSMTRAGPVDYAQPGRYRNERRGADITARNSHTQALIDSLIERPAGWDEAVAAARARLGHAGTPVAPETLAVLEHDLQALFAGEAVTPLADVPTV